jgi:CRP-like cAMP-binding protein
MTMDTKEFLKRTTLFGQCNDKELDTVLGTARQRRFPAGKVIIQEGHPGGRGFYLVLDGAAEVRTGDTHLATFGPGDYFGEMALLLEDTPRTADVVATEDTTCLVITQWDFKSLLNQHPDIATAILTELAKRLRNTDQALSD